MNTLLTKLLMLAGGCMVAGSMVATADWVICMHRSSSGTSCESSLTRAVAAWAAAAGWASGVAIQTSQQKSPHLVAEADDRRRRNEREDEAAQAILKEKID